NLLFVILMFATAIIIVVVIQTVGKSLIIKENYKFIEQKGRTVIAQLGQQVSYVEAMSKSLANVAQTLPNDAALFKKTIPQILYGNNYRAKIAGGGIWPEPYAFEPGTERRSFFWGCDAENRPLYFDSYNDPAGLGYHHEEWYVPARYLKHTDSFWSKSYIDPYSNEPMVTCTTPIYKNNQFKGVSTVDLKLNDLRNSLGKAAAALNGYIFAVDRNNKFLSFPDQSYVKILDKSIPGRVVKQFINVQQLAKKNSKFQKIADALQGINRKILNQNLKDSDYKDDLAKKIALESYQINFDEAKLIVTTFARKPLSIDLIPITIENDIIFNGPAIASIFLMPKTNWKIVLVLPENQLTSVADHISRQIFIYLSIGVLVCVFIAYLYLRSVLVLPLGKMTKQLIKAGQTKEKQLMALPETQNNELGDLAFWFNRRTDELIFTNQELKKEINSHKKSQKALKQSEERYRLMAENVADVIWSTDMNLQLTYISPSIYHQRGYKAKEAIKQSLEDTILPDSLQKVMLLFAQKMELIESGDPKGWEPTLFEIEQYHKDGTIIWTSNNARIFPGPDGKPISVLGVTRDITDYKKAEYEKEKLQVQLQQTQKMQAIGTLAGGIAHDFNNILSGIFGYSQLARMHIGDVEKTKNNIDQIIKGAQKATNLVKQILTFTRKSEHEMQPLKIFIEVKEAIKLLRSTIPSTIEIKENIVSKATVLADLTQIHQVVMNLCTNAYHSMIDKGGVLSVNLNEIKVINQNSIPDFDIIPGTYIKLEVSDTGSGMSPEILDKIFEPYFTTKEHDEGTGLGLAVVIGIVKEHNGFIKAYSKPGKGSSFHVYFPILED
ncbi:MAG: PAS domain S-box protein, partial [Desulfobacula sp.]|nr:PAS domain S-box protein [Desulfobacula sp.]